MGKNLCQACGLTFGNLKAFDTHRTGSFGEAIYKPSRTGKSRQVIGYTRPTRRCMALAEIKALGMTPNEKGWWMLPKQTASDMQENEEEREEATP